MKVFHLTRYANLESIQKYGILPKIPQNLDHYELFKSYKWGNDNNEIIYLWRDDGNLDKYIQDLIYAKYYIHPRIEYWQKNGENHCYEFSKKYTNALFGLEQDQFVLLKIENSFIYEIEHWQENSEDELNTSYYIDFKYTHRRKPVIIHPYPIYSFEIIQYYNVRIKRRKLNIS